MMTAGERKEWARRRVADALEAYDGTVERLHALPRADRLGRTSAAADRRRAPRRLVLARNILSHLTGPDAR